MQQLETLSDDDGGFGDDTEVAFAQSNAPEPEVSLASVQHVDIETPAKEIVNRNETAFSFDDDDSEESGPAPSRAVGGKASVKAVWEQSFDHESFDYSP